MCKIEKFGNLATMTLPEVSWRFRFAGMTFSKLKRTDTGSSVVFVFSSMAVPAYLVFARLKYDL